MNLSDTAFLLKSNLTLSLTRPGAFMHPPTTSITAPCLQHPFLGLFFLKTEEMNVKQRIFLGRFPLFAERRAN